jgi:hypothetical protein
MSFLTESSFVDLYNSAVRAFPNTTKRQHAVDPVVIETLSWTPFLGVRTLFVRAEARNETRHYNPIVLFKDVDYDGNAVKIIANDGQQYSFGKLSLEHNDILVRCNCPDFRYRFAWYDHLDHSLYGRTPSKYNALGTGPPANPLQLEGVCKHIMKMVSALRDSGLFLS